MKILIKPIDNLFFRDSRPFVRGEDRWADSLLVPNNSTVYGALRTAYFSAHPEEISKANTNEDKTSHLKIYEIGFCLSDEPGSIYLPAPADLVLDRTAEENKTVEEMERNLFLPCYLRPKKLEGVFTSYSNGQCLGQWLYAASDGQQVLPLDDAIIKKDDLLKGYPLHKEIGIRSLRKVTRREYKTGIGLDARSRTVADKMIYQISQMQYDKLRIYVDFSFNADGEDIAIPDSGFIKLGGQNNVCSYELYKPKESFRRRRFAEVKPDLEETKTRTLKVVLTSPAIFKNGWLPEFITDTEKMCGQIEIDGAVHKVTLLTSLLNGSRMIGGYGMKERHQKPLWRSVCAGTIYLLELVEEVSFPGAFREITLECKPFRDGAANVKLSQEGCGRAIVFDGKEDLAGAGGEFN